MKEIISRECYKLFHLKRLRWIVLLLLLMTYLMFSISIGWKRELVYVLLDETEAEREFFFRDGHIAQDIHDLLGSGHEDHTAEDGRYFFMDAEALDLFREGGVLHEKYQEYHFPERMVLQQMIGGYLAPPEQEDFEPRWRFHRMLTDFAAAAFTAILFTALFFSMDMTARGYQGALFTGQERKRLFWGKYVVFFFLFAVLSIVELALAVILFIPKLWLLPVSYIVKGFLLRSLADTGIALICVPLALLGRSEWKAVGLTLAVILLSMSGYAVINLYPYQFLTEAYWETCSELGTTLQIGMVTALIFAVSGFLSARLLQRMELK